MGSLNTELVGFLGGLNEMIHTKYMLVCGQKSDYMPKWVTYDGKVLERPRDAIGDMRVYWGFCRGSPGVAAGQGYAQFSWTGRELTLWGEGTETTCEPGAREQRPCAY